MKTLEAADYRNAVALINRASITGQEADYVAELKAHLLKHAEVLDRIDEPHAPSMSEVFDMERSSG